MKEAGKIEIIGENYFGSWDKTRIACRGIVMEKGSILLSYENRSDQWMIPGGGLESGEDERDCCIREISEETGLVIEPSECILEIDEYYEDCRYISRYYLGRITGKCERKLTAREREADLEARWLKLEEILEIFSRHAEYKETDEMKRGIYLREHTALQAILDNGYLNDL